MAKKCLVEVKEDRYPDGKEKASKSWSLQGSCRKTLLWSGYPLAGCFPAEPASVSPNRQSINRRAFQSSG